MGKSTGLGDNFYIGGANLSGDIASLSSIHGGNSPLTVTGINKSAIERIGGKRDGGISFTSYFNGDSLSGTHFVLSGLPTADAIMSYFRGTTLGNDAASMVAKQLNYDPTRADDGGLTFACEGQANAYGLEWGTQATPGIRTDSGAKNAAAVSSINFGAAGTNGLQAYLHVFSLGSGTATVKLQGSSDDGVADSYADITGGGFTAVTGAASQRIAVTGAVEQYLKVVTTGTFTNLVFAVNVVFNSTAVSF